jgi:thiol-disulfide isomerase/thioredoxin
MRGVLLITLFSLYGYITNAQSSMFEGIIEYTSILKQDSVFLRKTLTGFRNMGWTERQIRPFSADSTRFRYYIKQDSIWEEKYLSNDKEVYAIKYQAGFYAVILDVENGSRTVLSNEKSIEEYFNGLEKNPDTPNWRDKIKVSEWFKTDYSKLKKVARRREMINGFLCQLYELPPSQLDGDPKYFWITEEVKGGVAQQLPYFFDQIFSPKGLIVKVVMDTKEIKGESILRKITPGPIAPILPRLRSIDFGNLDSIQYKDEKFNQHLADKKIDDAPRLPDFSFYPVGSNQLDHLHRRLDSGKFVLIDLWGTWCGPCLRELPRLQAFQAEQAALLEVISLNLGDHRADYVQEIMTKHKMSGTQGYAGNLLKAFLNPGQSIPHAILLDPNMKVLWRGNPAGNWEKLAALVRGN